MLIHNLTLLDEEDCRDARNAELFGQLAVLVNIALADAYLASILGSQSLDVWAESTAWRTPRCPKINHQKLVLCSESGEVVVGNLYDCALLSTLRIRGECHRHSSKNKC